MQNVLRQTQEQQALPHCALAAAAIAVSAGAIVALFAGLNHSVAALRKNAIHRHPLRLRQDVQVVPVSRDISHHVPLPLQCP